ncbi:MAG: hypothetical protein ACLQRH_22685 [Acidimicrobiales bacterium]|jgi:hypothetical protein
MTVISAAALTMRPDRYEDFLTSTRKSKSTLEKCGARNVRLSVATSAGHSFVLSYEAVDFTDAGAIMDRFFADPEGVAVMAEANSDSGPVASWQSSTWMEIEL